MNSDDDEYVCRMSLWHADWGEGRERAETTGGQACCKGSAGGAGRKEPERFPTRSNFTLAEPGSAPSSLFRCAAPCRSSGHGHFREDWDGCRGRQCAQAVEQAGKRGQVERWGVQEE